MEKDVGGEHVEELKKMRRIMGDPHGEPPQIAIGEHYSGGYADFEDAFRKKQLGKFLKIGPY